MRKLRENNIYEYLTNLLKFKGFATFIDVTKFFQIDVFHCKVENTLGLQKNI